MEAPSGRPPSLTRTISGRLRTVFGMQSAVTFNVPPNAGATAGDGSWRDSSSTKRSSVASLGASSATLGDDDGACSRESFSFRLDGICARVDYSPETGEAQQIRLRFKGGHDKPQGASDSDHRHC